MRLSWGGRSDSACGTGCSGTTCFLRIEADPDTSTGLVAGQLSASLAAAASPSTRSPYLGHQRPVDSIVGTMLVPQGYLWAARAEISLRQRAVNGIWDPLTITRVTSQSKKWRKAEKMGTTGLGDKNLHSTIRF